MNIQKVVDFTYFTNERIIKKTSDTLFFFPFSNKTSVVFTKSTVYYNLWAGPILGYYLYRWFLNLSRLIENPSSFFLAE